MMEDKELYSKAFIYPSQQEWKEVIDSFPIIEELAFEGINNVNENSYADELDKLIAANDIFPWINRLNNKFSKLRFSYVLLKFYKLKGINDIRWAEHLDDGTTKYFPDFKDKGDYYIKFLFNYSCENFYYHYISALDILIHLINIYYNLGVEEEVYYFNLEVCKKLKPKNSQLFKLLEDFRKTNSDIYDDRNDLAHNFAFYEIDYRSRKVSENGKEVIHMGLEKYTTSDEAVNKVEHNVKQLAALLKEIEKELN